MNLRTLVPRPLDAEDGAECAVLLGALVTGVHLDRRRARALGWRGVRASGALRAWTCRVAGGEHVYGLAFAGESARGGVLRGVFDAYVFPNAAAPVLDVFPLEALRLALRDDYGEQVRAFDARAAAPFRLGSLCMEAALDGTGLALELTAPARFRVRSVDGVAAPGSEAWLVKPGAWECDVPAFRLLLRLFSTVAATAEALLEEAPRLAVRVDFGPVSGFDAKGTMRVLPDEREARISLRAAFGQAADGQGRALPRLPLRHLAGREERGDRPVLHILTGFLGAGKTTFLRRWLDFLHGRERYTGVIQNEFGQIGLDADLLRDDTQVEALDEGCVCCSLADSLRPGLLRLMDAMPAEQFILETTGLANPANVLAALNELTDIVLPGLVITVVDALDLEPDAFPLGGVRLAQVERADVLVVNKADGVDASALNALTERLRGLNSRALILPARYGAIAFAELDAWYSAWLDQRQAQLPSRRPRLDRLDETHAAEGYESLTVRPSGPWTEEDARALMDLAGPGLRRAKGVIELTGRGRVTLQYAAGILAFDPAPPVPAGGEEPVPYVILIGTNLRHVAKSLEKIK